MSEHKICGPEWWDAYNMRARGQKLPPGASWAEVDGYITADSEAGNCTLLCETDSEEEYPLAKGHRHGCGMTFAPEGFIDAVIAVCQVDGTMGKTWEQVADSLQEAFEEDSVPAYVNGADLARLIRGLDYMGLL